MDPSEESPQSYPIHAPAASRRDGGSELSEWQRNIREDVTELKDATKAIEARLSRLEWFQAMVLGATAAIGAVGGYLVAWIRGDK